MQNQKGYTIVELIIVIALACSVFVGIGLLYIIGHFLTKFW